MFCPNCGSNQPDNSRFCRTCGNSMAQARVEIVDTNRCAYHPNASSVGFCTNCGKPVCAQCKSEVNGMVYCSSCAGQELQRVNPPPAAAQKKSATGFVGPSIICAVVALGFFPPAFGLISIILGYLAFRRDRKAGTICMIVGFVCTIIGMVIGALVSSTIY